MGAFGELLIKHWGGDIEYYNGNKKKESNSNSYCSVCNSHTVNDKGVCESIECNNK